MPAAGRPGPRPIVVALSTPLPATPGVVPEIDGPLLRLVEPPPITVAVAPPPVVAPPMLWAPPVVPPPELVPIPVMSVVALLVSSVVVPLSKVLPVPGVVSPVAMVTPEALLCAPVSRGPVGAEGGQAVGAR